MLGNPPSFGGGSQITSRDVDRKRNLCLLKLPVAVIVGEFVAYR